MGRSLRRQSVFGLILVAILVAVGLYVVLPRLQMIPRAVVAHSVELSPSPHHQAAGPSTVPQLEATALSRSSVAETMRPPARQAADSERAAALGDHSAVDLSPSSWQNPFQADYWNTTGWRFDGSRMACDRGRSAVATFWRRYRRIMVSLRMRREPVDAEFRLRLTALRSPAVMDVCFSDRDVVVSVGQSVHSQQILERRTVHLTENPHGPNSVRLAATGNRVQVIWNDRRVLTCDQPAGQSGRDLLFSIVAPHGGLRITRLRIEGE